MSGEVVGKMAKSAKVARNGKEWQGMARNGKEWQGMARNGKEWQGMARNGKEKSGCSQSCVDLRGCVEENSASCKLLSDCAPIGLLIFQVPG